jgi:plasmid stability protein
MVTLTIKDVPDKVHRMLKKKAEVNSRSLNKEIINCLEAAVSPTRPKPKDYLESIRHLRRKADLHMTLEDIEKAIDDGRS